MNWIELSGTVPSIEFVGNESLRAYLIVSLHSEEPAHSVKNLRNLLLFRFLVKNFKTLRCEQAAMRQWRIATDKNMWILSSLV